MNTVKSLFTTALQSPSPELVQNILRRIDREETFRVQCNVGIFFVACTFFMVGFVESIRSAVDQLLQSGFITLAYSLLSDADAIAAGGLNTLYVFLESFPFLTASIALAMIICMSMLYSVFSRDIRSVAHSFIHTPLTHI